MIHPRRIDTGTSIARAGGLPAVGALAIGAAALAGGCAEQPLDLDDNPKLYIEEVAYRRGVLERDLTFRDDNYAKLRLQRYGIAGQGWEVLPERDPPSLPLTVDAVTAHRAGAALSFDDPSATRLMPEVVPATEEAWVALGRRVFFEYPMNAGSTYTTMVRSPDGLETSGFLTDEGAWVGLRIVRADDGSVRVSSTCAQCHASFAPSGKLDGVLSNRMMNVGHAKHIAATMVPFASLDELEDVKEKDLELLGPGHTDSLFDGILNLYRYPDFGGIRDLPFLNHTANFANRGVASIAVRAETLFITANHQTTLIPRALVWALAVYLRSLPPPPPLDEAPGPEAAKGKAVFESAGCPGCHTPPLYTSDQLISLKAIGTDPSAGLSKDRGTGFYRVPSLRGIGRKEPYLHHGPFTTLEEMFDPKRTEPGHTFGLELDASDRAALLAFLRSI